METRCIRLGALLLLALAVPASAAFHLMKVVELFPGTAAAPAAHYVVLQMYAPGQNLVQGHALTVHDAAGNVVGSFAFPSDVGNGANQAKLLIATPQAEAFFGIAADLQMDADLLAGGGKVCFAGSVDCVAWGGYSGTSSGVGTPFNAGGGLQSGRAVLRRLDQAGSATTLDAGDDTNVSATDFVFGLPAPRNNAGQLGQVPGATCGNGALEGLEQCDDGNLSDADACSSTCMVQAAPPAEPVESDFDGDFESDVLWRNDSTGANAAWRSARVGTQIAVTDVSNLAWNIVGVGDFDDDGRADVFWRNDSTGANTIWRSARSTTRLGVTTVANPAWRVAGVGDFDGDGSDDVFWRNTSSGANVIWRSAKASLRLAVASASPAWQVVAIGDFDGDGRDDVFWRNATSGANRLWRSANAATRIAVRNVASTDWQVRGAGDFNGDGRDDVFWRHAGTGANTIWRSANAATATRVTGVTNQAWQVVQIADFDGDGRDDLFWRNGGTGANTAWRSASSGTRIVVATVSNTAWKVAP